MRADKTDEEDFSLCSIFRAHECSLMLISRYNRTMRSLFCQLRIHVWGGLGSQLHAVALAYSLQKRYPHRKITLVLHTSGVTKRNPEIYELFPEWRYLEIDDFNTRDLIQAKPRLFVIRHFFGQIVKAICLISGIIADENDGGMRRVRSWTIAVRGHYFHREIETDFLQLLSERLSSIYKITQKENAVIHYRLGDLLDLQSKQPIDVSRISKVTKATAVDRDFLVFSDSHIQAVRLLENSLPSVSFKTESLSTPETIFIASESEIFIGTSSKVSYWISLLRIRVNQARKTFMPLEDRIILNKLGLTEEEITFY